ncbi:4166_t:CDS:2, partial [Cetraspora pellucida]
MSNKTIEFEFATKLYNPQPVEGRFSEMSLYPMTICTRTEFGV